MLVDGGSSSDTSTTGRFSTEKEKKSRTIFDRLPRPIAGLQKRTKKNAKDLNFINGSAIRRQCREGKDKFLWKNLVKLKNI